MVALSYYPWERAPPSGEDDLNREEIENKVGEEIDKRSSVCEGRFVSKAWLFVTVSMCMGGLLTIAMTALGFANDQTAKTSALEVQVIELEEEVDRLQEIYAQLARIEAMVQQIAKEDD